jgi:hypothetical protein
MILTGIGDEAANTIDGQLKAHQELGWKWIEMRGVEVRASRRRTFTTFPMRRSTVAVEKLQAQAIRVYCFGSTIMNWAKTVATPFDVHSRRSEALHTANAAARDEIRSHHEFQTRR